MCQTTDFFFGSTELYRSWEVHCLFTRPTKKRPSCNDHKSRHAIRHVRRSTFCRMLFTKRRGLGFCALLPLAASGDRTRTDLPIYLPSLRTTQYSFKDAGKGRPILMGTSLVYRRKPKFLRRIQIRRGVDRRASAVQCIPGVCREWLVALGCQF